MRLKLIFALVWLFSLAILLPVSSAFPLTGGNGVVNATVYGVSEEFAHLFVDMSASEGDSYDVEIIDSEDRVYDPSSYLFGQKSMSSYNGSKRDTVIFDVPKTVVIKRVKVTPKKSDPFMIEWEGVPEATGTDTMLKFYGATNELMFSGGYRKSISDALNSDRHKYKWTFDIKLTNMGSSTLSFENDEFFMKDTTGWGYTAHHGDGKTKKLLPGESIRFPIEFKYVGEFSRPSELIFRDLTMNTEAWS